MSDMTAQRLSDLREFNTDGTILDLLDHIAALEKQLGDEIILPIGGTSKYECPHCKDLQAQVADLKVANAGNREACMRCGDENAALQTRVVDQLAQVAALERIQDISDDTIVRRVKRIEDLEAKVAALEAAIKLAETDFGTHIMPDPPYEQ